MNWEAEMVFLCVHGVCVTFSNHIVGEDFHILNVNTYVPFFQILFRLSSHKSLLSLCTFT